MMLNHMALTLSDTSLFQHRILLLRKTKTGDKIEKNNLSMQYCGPVLAVLYHSKRQDRTAYRHQRGVHVENRGQISGGPE